MSRTARRTVALAAIVLLTFGCAAHVIAPPPLPPPPPTSIECPVRDCATAAPEGPVREDALEEPARRTLVRFPFATDRAKGNPAAPNEYFLGRQADTLGECVVSIPPGHKSGKVERPWSIFGHEFEEKLNDHVVLTAVRESLRAHFFEGLRTRMHEAAARLGPLDARDVLVFVHGYNTTFAEAAWRTAQLSHDLRFPGVALLYSWSSAGDTKAYLADGENARLSAPHLRQLLVDLASVPDTRYVHVVAHSMGNRVVTEALMRLSPAERRIVNAKLNRRERDPAAQNPL